MKLFEYEAKQVLAREGVTVPRSVLLEAGEDPAEKAVQAGLKPPIVVKAQVLVGGRGKAGGVRVAESWDELREAAREILERGVRGIRPRLLLLEEYVEHTAELYLSIVLDRASRAPVMIASSMGGVDIEETARRSPEKIAKLTLDPFLGGLPSHGRRLARRIGLRGQLLRGFSTLAWKLYNVFTSLDAELVEINPLAVTSEGNLVALDAKIIVDDNAAWRHPELEDPERLLMGGELSEWELKARRLGLAFVELDGDVGIIGNGAGLTMATMDLVAEAGGRPANFLDIGGGASAERVEKALGLLYEYPKARSILFNVYGGITRGDEVAKGIVAALERLGERKPLVVRLEGTLAREGRRILQSHGLHVYEDPLEAAREAVRLAAAGR